MSQYNQPAYQPNSSINANAQLNTPSYNAYQQPQTRTTYQNTGNYQSQPDSSYRATNPNAAAGVNLGLGTAGAGLGVNAGTRAGTSTGGYRGTQNSRDDEAPTYGNMVRQTDELYDLMDKDQQKALNTQVGSTICCLFVVFLIFNSAFIIPDLIFAGQDTKCVTTPVNGFAFPLRTWLRVDAYARLIMSLLIMVYAILACTSFKRAMHLQPCAIAAIIIYSLFLLAWLIVGAIMFWGKLDPSGACEGGVRTYMYVFLILGFIGVCCNVCGSRGGF